MKWSKFWFSAFAITILTKVLAFHTYADILSNAFILTLAVLGGVALFFALLLLLPGRWHLPLLLAGNAVISFVLFSNTVYFSYFLTIIPKESLFQLGEAQGVGESITELIKAQYFWYFADLGFWLAGWFVTSKKAPLPSLLRSRKQKQAGIFLLLGLILYGAAFIQLSGKNELGKSVYLQLGVVNYHLIDLLGMNEALPTMSDLEVQSQLADYRSQIPMRDERLFHGVSKNMNLLMIQLESFQANMLNLKIDGVEVTPNLNKLARSSLYFPNFFQENGLGNTADAEFIMNTSIFPTTGGAVYKLHSDVTFLTLAKQLKKNGYHTFAFHGYDKTFYSRHQVLPKLGFDKYYSESELNNEQVYGMGISDESVYQQMLPVLEQHEPFYSMVMTLTSHHPFYAPPSGFQFEKDFAESLVGRYLNAIRYTDKAVGKLMELLQNSGLSDRTVVVFYGDHRGVTMDDKAKMSELLGKEYDDLEMYGVPLIIHVPNQAVKGEFDLVGGTKDIYPTLANLMDLELPPFAMGRDLINAKQGFVAYRAYLPQGSFITDELFFKMSNDYRFVNGTCRDFKTGEKLELEACREKYDLARELFTITDYIFSGDPMKRMEEFH